MIKVVLSAFLILCLGGCGQYLGYAKALETQTIQDRRDYNDAKAQSIVALSGDISVGALGRMPLSQEKCAIAAIWGLDLVQCQMPQPLSFHVKQ